MQEKLEPGRGLYDVTYPVCELTIREHDPGSRESFLRRRRTPSSSPHNNMTPDLPRDLDPLFSFFFLSHISVILGAGFRIHATYRHTVACQRPSLQGDTMPDMVRRKLFSPSYSQLTQISGLTTRVLRDRTRGSSAKLPRSVSSRIPSARSRLPPGISASPIHPAVPILSRCRHTKATRAGIWQPSRQQLALCSVLVHHGT